MTSTYQRNALDISYNGWENYETWNVALWVQNDEGLYHLAQDCGDYETLVNVLYEEYGVKETRDGVSFKDPKVNVVQLNSDVFDFQILSITDPLGEGVIKYTSHILQFITLFFLIMSLSIALSLLAQGNNGNEILDILDTLVVDIEQEGINSCAEVFEV